MTHHNSGQEDHHDASADAGHGGDPQPANEALPDGQFQNQEMPTTDGEPASDDSAASAGAESPEEGDAAMRAAEEATKND